MTTKHSILTLTIILVSFPVFGQDSRSQVRQELEQLSGIAYVKLAAQLSTLEYEAGNYAASLVLANEVYEGARKEKHDFYEALGAILEAQAYLSLNSAGDQEFRRSLRRLKRANKFLEDYPDPALRVRSLKLTQELALALDKGRIMEKAEEAIAENEGLIEETEAFTESFLSPAFRAPAPDAVGHTLPPPVRKRDTSLYQVIRQNEVLQTQLTKYEAKLNQLSQDSMKAELMRARLQTMNDSLHMVTQADSLQIAQQELAISRQKAKNNWFLAIGGVILLLFVGVVARFLEIRSHNRILATKNEMIKAEKERSEKLLLNILPAAVAHELEVRGTAQARRYKDVTVLFTDFKDFSVLSKEFSPEELVSELDFLFSEFDRIITRHRLEKIKTIGDSYMCAGGLPEEDLNHAERIISAALDIQGFLEGYQAARKKDGRPFFEARYGVHTGPVIAGVVGLRKFSYDIWGSTVNVASRLESKGAVGRINVSGTTYEHLKDKFAFNHRGKVNAKNVGEIEMYFVQN